MRAFLILIFLVPQAALAQRFPWNSFQRLALPNSVSLESTMGESALKTKALPGLRAASSASDDANRFISMGTAVNFTVTPSYASLFGWSFQWTPQATFSGNRLSMNNTTFGETSMNWYRAGVGLGPELGWTSLVGTFYTSLIPELNYSYASWSSSNDNGNTSQMDWRVSLNAGYFKYITRDWVMKAFVRQSVEDAGLWKKALSAQGQDVESAAGTYAGLALTYVY